MVPETNSETDKLCRQCHARIAGPSGTTTCPACGGLLVSDPSPSLDQPNSPPRQIDHRGIVLPARHAVGGVITPR